MAASSAYKDAGVDVHAGYEAVSLIKKHVQSTMRPEVLADVGGFAAMFSLESFKGLQAPVMVSSTDGVGTKLKIAFLADNHTTVGIDCVAMCVNDLITCGATPLFFLDYIACGKVAPARIEQIVAGMAEGCRQAGASLIGGETAEHPGMMPEDEYDLAGFSCGIIDRANIIDGSKIVKNDLLIGIASSGVHSNGFSLIRHVLKPEISNINKHVDEFGVTLGEELLRPTRIYVKSALELVEKIEIKGFANITGGGFFENIPRMFPDGVGGQVELGSWQIPPVFEYIQKTGKIAEADMFSTFNMGIGMVAAVSEENADAAIAVLHELGERAFVIGRVVKGEGLCLR